MPVPLHPEGGLMSPPTGISTGPLGTPEPKQPPRTAEDKFRLFCSVLGRGKQSMRLKPEQLVTDFLG